MLVFILKNFNSQVFYNETLIVYFFLELALNANILSTYARI